MYDNSAISPRSQPTQLSNMYRSRRSGLAGRFNGVGRMSDHAQRNDHEDRARPRLGESTMKTRKLGTPGSLGDGRGMHEHQRQLRPARRQAPGHQRSSAPPTKGRHLLRHRRGLWPLHERGTRRRGARPVPRPGHNRDQVRLRPSMARSASTAGPSTSSRSSRHRSSA